MQPKGSLHAHALRVTLDPPPTPDGPLNPQPAPVPGTHRRGDASVIRSTDERSGTSSRYRLGARHTREASPGPSRIPPAATKQHPSPPRTARRAGGGAITPRSAPSTSPTPLNPRPTPVPGTRRGDASVIRSTDERNGTPARYDSAIVPQEASPAPFGLAPPGQYQHPSPSWPGRGSREGGATPRVRRSTPTGRRREPGPTQSR